MVSGFLAGVLRLSLVAGAAVYVGLVFRSYRAEGSQGALRLEISDPARSAGRLLVWLGVKAVATALRIGGGIFSNLSEASAEVGDWFLRNRKPEVQEAVRSRFMF